MRVAGKALKRFFRSSWTSVWRLIVCWKVSKLLLRGDRRRFTGTPPPSERCSSPPARRSRTRGIGSNAALAVGEGDRARARGRVDEAGVERDEARPPAQLRDVDAGLRLGADGDGVLVGLVVVLGVVFDIAALLPGETGREIRESPTDSSPQFSRVRWGRVRRTTAERMYSTSASRSSGDSPSMLPSARGCASSTSQTSPPSRRGGGAPNPPP